MNKFVVAAAALSISASAVFAGGPVVVVEEVEPEVIATAPRSGMALPLILGAVLLAAIASSSDGS